MISEALSQPCPVNLQVKVLGPEVGKTEAERGASVAPKAHFSISVGGTGKTKQTGFYDKTENLLLVVSKGNTNHGWFHESHEKTRWSGTPVYTHTYVLPTGTEVTSPPGSRMCLGRAHSQLPQEACHVHVPQRSAHPAPCVLTPLCIWLMTHFSTKECSFSLFVVINIGHTDR